jgi:predicted transcriptional regulator
MGLEELKAHLHQLIDQEQDEEKLEALKLHAEAMHQEEDIAFTDAQKQALIEAAHKARARMDAGEFVTEEEANKRLWAVIQK